MNVIAHPTQQVSSYMLMAHESFIMADSLVTNTFSLASNKCILHAIDTACHLVHSPACDTICAAKPAA